MEVYCTRPSCPRPRNLFADLDDITTLKTTQQKYCSACGMPLLLDGRYIPTKILGKGGFGAAFMARDRRIPGMRPCVVKLFQPAGNLTSSQMQLAQGLFEREAEVLAQIGHEHEQIPELFAFFPVTVPSLQPGHQDQLFYLVQEYIDGRDLEAELAAKGKFSEAEVVELLREILPVLKFVHDQGIIHRDIKPSNIMRRQDGRIFLLDFGAVKQVATTSNGSLMASTGIYSLGFSPPEQMAGGQVFPSTDLYALAVTSITLITGSEPSKLFDTYSNQWQWRSQANVSPKLADILDRMLLPAAKERFQSAQEVLSALARPDRPLPLPVSGASLPQRPTIVLPTFSLVELIAGAAFSGFEGALIAIALLKLVQNPLTTSAIACVILAILIFAQAKRWIEKLDLVIIVVISGLIIYFVPFFKGVSILGVIIVASAAALISIATALLLRLIYRLISLIF